MSSGVQPARCGKRFSTGVGTGAGLPADAATCSGMWWRKRCGLWHATPSPAQARLLLFKWIGLRLDSTALHLGCELVETRPLSGWGAALRPCHDDLSTPFVI